MYGLSEERLTLDWGRTLSSGAPVFRTNARLRSGGDFVDGVMAGGTITLSRLPESQLDEVFAHERVHIVQRDFLKTTTGLLAEDWVRSKVGLDRAGLVDHLIAGIAYGPFDYLLFGVWGRARDFREVEADFLVAR